MVEETERRTDGLPPGVTEGDVERALLEEDLTAEYAPTAAEELGVAVEAWARQSRVVTVFWNTIRVRTMLKNGSRRDKAKELDAEITKITDEQAAPAKEELNVHTQVVIDLFAGSPLMRSQVGIWLQVPPNLRILVKKGLYARKIDIREMCDKAEEIEREREKRALESV